MSICSGSVAGGEHTYALMDERVPAPRRLGRTEALAELALRYFTGHGPATERDLAYWATLTLTDVRAGLLQVRDQLDSFRPAPVLSALREVAGQSMQVPYWSSCERFLCVPPDLPPDLGVWSRGRGNGAE